MNRAYELGYYHESYERACNQCTVAAIEKADGHSMSRNPWQWGQMVGRSHLQENLENLKENLIDELNKLTKEFHT